MPVKKISDLQHAVEERFQDSIRVKEATLACNRDTITEAVQVIAAALRNQQKMLLFGNGGSAADCQHIAAEFVGRFQRERRAWPVLALTTDSSALTALGNDYGFDAIFVRQVEAFGRADDIAFGISTSGNSRNVVAGLEKARAMGLRTIGLTGEGGRIVDMSDIVIRVPSAVTARIQEAHICVAHCLCELVEEMLIDG